MLKLATAWMLNVLDDCDRQGARHPSRVFIPKLPMTRHRYLSNATSPQLFVTDTLHVALSVSSHLGPPIAALSMSMNGLHSTGECVFRFSFQVNKLPAALSLVDVNPFVGPC